MRFSTSIVAAVVIGYSLSCVSRDHNQLPANPPSEKPVTILRPVPAVLNEETHPAVHGVETKIKGESGSPYEFRHAQFVDENHGWVMSLKSIYRTTDAGKSWEQLPQEPDEDTSFVTFCFVDALRGWLLTVKHDSSKKYPLDDSSRIMVTYDGGKSWEEQASFPNEVGIKEIRFLNENDGLAVGHRFIDDRRPYAEILVLKTSNGGKSWNNISEAAKTASANDSGKYIEWPSPAVTLLLTQRGRVIRTGDGGKTWTLVASFKDERPNGFASSTGFHQLALDPQQRVRVVAGASGDEGYWGDFVVDEDGRWTSYEIFRTPILDAVFLSEKEVLACGMNVRRVGEESNRRIEDAGVILRSFDTGKSWQSIYRSKSHETFFYITKIKDNEFYAVSDAGTFLRFTLPQS